MSDPIFDEFNRLMYSFGQRNDSNALAAFAQCHDDVQKELVEGLRVLDQVWDDSLSVFDGFDVSRELELQLSQIHDMLTLDPRLTSDPSQNGMKETAKLLKTLGGNVVEKEISGRTIQSVNPNWIEKSRELYANSRRNLAREQDPIIGSPQHQHKASNLAARLKDIHADMRNSAPSILSTENKAKLPRYTAEKKMGPGGISNSS